MVRVFVFIRMVIYTMESGRRICYRVLVLIYLLMERNILDNWYKERKKVKEDTIIWMGISIKGIGSQERRKGMVSMNFFPWKRNILVILKRIKRLVVSITSLKEKYMKVSIKITYEMVEEDSHIQIILMLKVYGKTILYKRVLWY